MLKRKPCFIFNTRHKQIIKTGCSRNNFSYYVVIRLSFMDLKSISFYSDYNVNAVLAISRIVFVFGFVPDVEYLLERGVIETVSGFKPYFCTNIVMSK